MLGGATHCFEQGPLRDWLPFVRVPCRNAEQSRHGGLTDAYSEEQGKVWIILVLVNHCDKRRAGLDWLGSVLYEIGGHVGGAGVALTAHHHRGQGSVWILGLSSLFAPTCKGSIHVRHSKRMVRNCPPVQGRLGRSQVHGCLDKALMCSLLFDDSLHGELRDRGPHRARVCVQDGCGQVGHVIRFIYSSATSTVI